MANTYTPPGWGVSAQRAVVGRLVTATGVKDRAWVLLGDDSIVAVGEGPPPVGAVSDVGSCLVAPGFIDVHVHGGAGAQAAGSSAAQVKEAVTRFARFHATHGTTCLLAATVSESPERLAVTVQGIAQAVREPGPGAAVVAGAHLEGPWLAPSRRGAHDPGALRPPGADELASLLEIAGDSLRMITMAPELPGATQAIKAAVEAGIIVSVGHTDADYDTVRGAFDLGARHLTHCGNAMGPLNHRRPGAIGAALTDDRVTIELIADGEHVHPGFLKLVSDAAPGRVVAVTDATSATGMPDGYYQLGHLPVTVADGRVTLVKHPGTLAGSVLTMDRAVATLVAAGISIQDAIGAASKTPGRLVGPRQDGRLRGELAPGYCADIVVLDERLEAQATMVGGEVVYDAGGYFDAIGHVERKRVQHRRVS